jgi:simple sugar transport system ATP-binding protein
MTHPPALEARDISKRFDTVLANDNVSLCLRTGEIHAVLGENGAGKSTLMNIICGLYKPDTGDIYVGGKKAAIQSPRVAIGLGIGMVHQHFMLIPTLTVAENIMLGAESNRWGFITKSNIRHKIGVLSYDLGLAVDPDAVAGNLSVGVQQRVEILKALYRGANIMVLDEPTAVLTPPEVEKLFGVLHQLRVAGVSIIFISHKLAETMKIADRISIMRSGRKVETVLPSQTTQSDLAELMVGRKVVSRFDKPSNEPGKVVLKVEDLTVMNDRKIPVVSGVSFCVRAGEILGIAGIQGNGQTELVAALNGLGNIESGVIRLDGNNLVKLPPRKIMESGVAHIPEDRRKHGLVLDYSIADNQVLNAYYRRPFARHFQRDALAINAHSRELLKQFDIRAAEPSRAVATLSGGNQQKVILSRELSRKTRLLIANQPTRGLDVGAIEYVRRRLLAMRNRGVAVLLVSVELEEIMSLADTVAVMYEGRIVAMQAVGQVSSEQLGLLMTGA